MFKILIIGIIIVLVILVLSVMTINKGYAYKHSVDKLEDNPYTKTARRIHNTLRILLLILGHIISSIRLLAGQHNFLPLSQFLLGTLLFLIILGQIKKKRFRNRIYLDFPHH